MLHHCTKSILYLPTCLSVHFKGHFSRWTSVSRFYFVEAKDDGSGGDNWSYKPCKAPVKLSLPTNQHPTFYRPDTLPVAQPTMSKHWREIFTDISDVLCPLSLTSGGKLLQIIKKIAVTNLFYLHISWFQHCIWHCVILWRCKVVLRQECDSETIII